MVDNLIHAVKRHSVKSPIPLREIQLPSAGATGHSGEHGLLRDDDDRRRDGDDKMHDGDDNRIHPCICRRPHPGNQPDSWWKTDPVPPSFYRTRWESVTRSSKICNSAEGG